MPVGILNSSWGVHESRRGQALISWKVWTGSSSEAKRILSEGGLNEIKLKEEKYNKQAREANENYFSVKLQNTRKYWRLVKVDLDDLDFSMMDFDDSNWDTFDTKNSEKKSLLMKIFLKRSFRRRCNVIKGFWYRRAK